MPAYIYTCFLLAMPRNDRLTEKDSIGLNYLEGDYLSKAARQNSRYIVDNFEENKQI